MGVNSRALVRRLRAWTIGAPVARGTTIQTTISEPERRFLLAFVRMGGESRPWGVAWKCGTAAVKHRTVGEPRMREFVDEMMEEIVEDLAKHLGHPSHAKLVDPSRKEFEQATLPQIWVPNSSHIDMLHFLAYAYARRRGDEDRDKTLRLLGRMGLHLFLESRRPGQQIIVDASKALRSAYDFPCEDSRQAHLGLLMAWLENRGSRDKGLSAALDAERLPIAISLDPELERIPLSDLVDDYNKTRKNRGKGDKATAKKIHDVLQPELERRIQLVTDTIRLIETDERPYNDGLLELEDVTRSHLYHDFLKREDQALKEGKEPYAPDPETDRDPRSATYRFYMNSASQDRERNALIHFDRELEAEAINDGSAFRGVITSVSEEGPGRTTIPVWTIEDSTPGALSLRQWDKVCIVGTPRRTAVIREILPTDDGRLEVVIEITNLKKSTDEPWPHSMAGTDQSWLGQAVTIIGTSFARMTEEKAFAALERNSAPGDWMITKVSPSRVQEDDE